MPSTYSEVATEMPTISTKVLLQIEKSQLFMSPLILFQPINGTVTLN